MADFAVLEPDGSLARRLAARFGPAVKVREKPALLVVAPGGCLTRGSRQLECGTVLLPGEGPHQMELIRARSAVSYGLSGRDTLTLSSREGARLWVALQRELVQMDGTVLERQEFPVRMPVWADELQTLALTGAMLLLGMEPEEINNVEI